MKSSIKEWNNNDFQSCCVDIIADVSLTMTDKTKEGRHLRGVQKQKILSHWKYDISSSKQAFEQRKSKLLHFCLRAAFDILIKSYWIFWLHFGSLNKHSIILLYLKLKRYPEFKQDSEFGAECFVTVQLQETNSI